MSAVAEPTRRLDHIRALEAEAIHVMREVAAEFERPVLLFCGGKDSIVLLRLAEKAFRPAPFPFPLMHVDTGHNFPEVIEFRDRRVERARRAADRRLGAGVDRHGGGWSRRPARGPRATAADGDAAGRDRRARLRRGFRRRPPRRGAGAGEGADLLLPRRLRPVGPEGPAAGDLEPLQRPDPQGASTCASSRSATGPSSTCGSTSPRRSWRCRRSTSPTSARSSNATACSTRRAEWTEFLHGRGAVHRERALPHGRRHDLHRRRALRRASTLREVVEEIAATRVTERGETRADDRVTEAAMEDRKREGYF